MTPQTAPLPAPADAIPLPPALGAIYEAVYSTDLVYIKDCWKLCGDAHCCSFQRYKSQYKVIAQQPFQELPMLPGEWQWLQQRGWTAQFEPFEVRVLTLDVNGRAVNYQSVVSRRPGCACDHATRPTICRLYPLLPRFDIEGQLVGMERAGIYEEMESIGGLPSACRIENVPLAQIEPLLALTSALGRSALLRWHLEAYRLAKHHVARRLQMRVAETGRSVFHAFESALLRGALLDKQALVAELSLLMQQYDERWPGWADPSSQSPQSP